MRIALDVVGVLLVLMGGLWFLQGINVLGGSVMSGQSMWVGIGAVVGIIGIGLLVFANRRRKA
jgi:nucleoside recognition membrane protein YjiH